MELCCTVNGNRRCTGCYRTFCDQHVYNTQSPTYFVPIPDQYMCYDCYNINVRKPLVERPREGLTYSELYLEVRKLTPTGFVSIEVKLQDHRPGIGKPELTWSVYHEKLNHSVGKTPEQALALFKTALTSYTERSSPIENVNI